MGVILKEFDDTLEKTEIIMPLLSSSQDEAGDDYQNEKTDKSQTATFGIQTPLIMINKTVIDFDAVLDFSITSNGQLPNLTLTVEDKFELMANLDKPGKDNEVRIQILPKFDEAYKKINLTFFITDINVNGTIVSLSGVYKLSSLTSSQYKTFGEIDTYNLFRKIAQDTKLGFASNVTTLSDNRFVYCDNKSLLDIMSSEIEISNSTEHILDWWIDFWDNVNLADIKERYNTIDNDEDLQVWVTGQCTDITVNQEVSPTQVVAVINNHPSMSSSELFVSDYAAITMPGGAVNEGSDTVYSVYEDNESDYNDYFVQDGDIKKDIFIHYEYLGENYGPYNYTLAKNLRSAYIRKMKSEQVKVTMKTPMLGLMRGHKVNFLRYTNNDKVENRIKVLEENGFVNRNVESNIPLSKYDIPEEERLSNGNFILDRTVSAQYLISEVEISYSENEWKYILTLVKPASTNVSILAEVDE